MSLQLQLLSPTRRQLLEALGQCAQECDTKAYVVGGFVRDLLLGQVSDDIDIMVESNLIEFISKVTQTISQTFQVGKIKNYTYKKYFTAKLLFETPIDVSVSHLDLSQARGETYEFNGARPQTFPSTFAVDIKRRDFSINAIALSLAKDSLFNLIDIVNGECDLSNKLLRVLHKDSFLDDPIRLIRAVRFEKRFGFHLEEETNNLFFDAIKAGVIKNILPLRMEDELKKVSLDNDAESVFEELRKYGVI